MYSLGQTLWDIEKQEVVLYLGMNSTKRATFGKIWLKRKDGTVEKDIENWKGLSNIIDKDGNIRTGRYSIPCYFGRFPYKEYRNWKPDESIAVDNINFFVGEKKNV